MDFKFNPDIEKELYDVCIVGAGASGLMAANVILREKPDCKLLLVDAKDRPGRKIAASGNGKCNLSNIKSEGWSIVSAFFGYLGVLTKHDGEGRIYPYSEYAPDVVEALTNKLESADWLLSSRLTSVKYAKGVFLAAARQDASSVKLKGKGAKSKQVSKNQKSKTFSIKARRLVLACGGTASPQLGTCGDGFALAKQLAHAVREPVPALCGIRTEQNMKKLGLSGVRQKALVSLTRRSDLLAQEAGEVQFTDYGLSGICVFNMTRFIAYEDVLKDRFSDYSIKLDFLPEFDEKQVEGFLERSQGSLCSILKPQLANYINTISEDYRSLANVIKCVSFDIAGLCDWDKAQVTRGGVIQSEFNPNTMESHKLNGLYFTGEIVDFDGACGGFNLQHAWETGMKCGQDIVAKL